MESSSRHSSSTQASPDLTISPAAVALFKKAIDALSNAVSAVADQSALPEPHKAFWIDIFDRTAALFSELVSERAKPESIHPDLLLSYSDLSMQLTGRKRFLQFQSFIGEIHSTVSFLKSACSQLSADPSALSQRSDSLQLDFLKTVRSILFEFNPEAVVPEEDFAFQDEETVLFWYRFFGITCKSVLLEVFAQAYAIHYQVTYNYNLPQQSCLKSMISETMLLPEGHMIEHSTYGLWLIRFGPLRHSFKKMRGLFNIQGAPVEWFLPHIDRNGSIDILSSGQLKLLLRYSSKNEHQVFTISHSLTSSDPSDSGHIAIYCDSKSYPDSGFVDDLSNLGTVGYFDIRECVLELISLINEDAFRSESSFFNDMKQDSLFWLEYDSKQATEREDVINIKVRIEQFFKSKRIICETQEHSKRFHQFLEKCLETMKAKVDLELFSSIEGYSLCTQEEIIYANAMCSLHVALADDSPNDFSDFVLKASGSPIRRRSRGLSAESRSHSESRPRLGSGGRSGAKTTTTIHPHVFALQTYRDQGHCSLFVVMDKARNQEAWFGPLVSLLDLKLVWTDKDINDSILNALQHKGPILVKILDLLLSTPNETFAPGVESKKFDLKTESRSQLASHFNYPVPREKDGSVPFDKIFNAILHVPSSLPMLAFSEINSLLRCMKGCLRVLFNSVVSPGCSRETMLMVHQLANMDITPLRNLFDISMREKFVGSSRASSEELYHELVDLVLEYFLRIGSKESKPTLAPVSSVIGTLRKSVLRGIDSSAAAMQLSRAPATGAVSSQPIDLRDAHGKTAAHIAAEKGNSILVQKLVETWKLDPNLVDNRNNTILHIISENLMSVYFWRESEVKDLVQKNGLNVNARNIHNRTALASVLDILLTPENNLTPEQVNWYSNFALLLVLLQSSVDSLDDRHGSLLNSLLYELWSRGRNSLRFLVPRFAVLTLNYHLLKLILSGYDEFPDRLPFFKAAPSEHQDHYYKVGFRKLIYEFLTEVNDKIPYHVDDNLLHIAVRTGSLSIVELLLSYLEDRRRCNLSSGIMVDENDWTFRCQFIGIDDVGGDGRTALHLCAASPNRGSSNLEIAKLLLKNNANIIRLDNAKYTALHYAAWCQQTEIVDLLLQSHMTPNVKCKADGRTPLHLAAYRGAWQIVFTLLTHGAQSQIDLPCYNGFTPLGYALQRQLELDQGIELSGQSPAHIGASLRIEDLIPINLAQEDLESAQENIEYTSVTLLSYNASLEIAMLALSQVRENWDKTLEKGWHGFKDDVFDVKSKFTHLSSSVMQDRLAELFQNRGHQIILNGVYEKRVKPRLIILLLVYLVFLLLSNLFVVWEISRSKSTFTRVLEKSLFELFVDEEFQFLDSPFGKNWKSSDQISHFFMWAKGPLLNAIYPQDLTSNVYYNGDTLESRDFSFFNGRLKMLGSPRFRQVRGSMRTCGTSVLFAETRCIDFNEDRQSFGPDAAWTWTSAEELGRGRPVWEKIDVYSGSGFVVHLPYAKTSSMRNETLDLIDFLESNHWIDLRTRAVYFEMSVYSHDDGLFAWISMPFEIGPSGGVVTSHEISVNRFQRYYGDSNLLYAFEILVFLFMLGWTIFHCVKIYSLGWSYFSRWYNFITVLKFLMFYLSMLIHFVALGIEESINWDTEVDFVNLSLLKELWVWQRAFLAVFILLAWFNTFEYLSTWRPISKFVIIIEFIISTLGPFFLVLSCFVFAFSSAFFVAYGYKSHDSYTFWLSFLNRVRDTFLGSSLEEQLSYNRVLGFLLFTVFSITVTLVLLNLLIAIMDTAFDQASQEVGAAHWAKFQYSLIEEHEKIDEAFNGFFSAIQRFFMSLRRRDVPWVLRSPSRRKAGLRIHATTDNGIFSRNLTRSLTMRGNLESNLVGFSGAGSPSTPIPSPLERKSFSNLIPAGEGGLRKRTVADNEDDPESVVSR